MKNWIKILSALALVGVVAAYGGYKFIYNKPHMNYEKAKPDFTLQAADLFAEFRYDPEKAETKFNGKVVELKGLLSKVEKADSLTIAVFAFAQGLFGEEGIRCTMLPAHSSPVHGFTGKNITLKGFCSGYNGSDIILEKSSIIYSY